MFEQIIAFIVGIILFGLIVSELLYIVRLNNERKELANWSVDSKEEVKYLKDRIEKEERDIYNIRLNNSHRIYPEKEKHGVVLRKKVNLNYLNTRIEMLKESGEERKELLKSINREELKSIFLILFFAALMFLVVGLVNGDLKILLTKYLMEKIV